MRDDKEFTDFEISLKSMAGKLSITSHQLSQYLNEHRNKNFNSFINECRIREAKILIKEDAQRSAISVAYAIGFSNYTTFQQSFKKETGLSPAAYKLRIKTSK